MDNKTRQATSVQSRSNGRQPVMQIWFAFAGR